MFRERRGFSRPPAGSSRPLSVAVFNRTRVHTTPNQEHRVECGTGYSSSALDLRHPGLTYFAGFPFFLSSEVHLEKRKPEKSEGDLPDLAENTAGKHRAEPVETDSNEEPDADANGDSDDEREDENEAVPNKH
jgi:hypothetical protein